jgi:hypothetical protein
MDLPLKPVTLMYLGDAYRFYLDQNRLPEIALDHVDRFELGTTHAEQVEWEKVPMELKEHLIEIVATL